MLTNYNSMWQALHWCHEQECNKIEEEGLIYSTWKETEDFLFIEVFLT